MNTQLENTGLTVAEAEKRLAKYGFNVLTKKKKKSPISLFLCQFKDVMTLVLLACTCISFFMQDRIEAIIMAGIVIINGILGFVQEFRTEKTIEMLKSMTANTADVIRDGIVQKIKAEEIVPGDVVQINRGDIVPADGVVISASELSIDESMLTGESNAVNKSELNDKDRNVFSGTMIITGKGKMLVTQTGMNTKMGKISGMIQNVSEEATPLQKKLSNMGKYIVFGCMLVCIIVTLTGILRGETLIDMLLTGISLAVAAVPEGLPAIVTISLALGVKRMADKNALIRKLPAVETLGSTTVICSDKTGTLTQNKMRIKEIYALSDFLPFVFKLCNNRADATEIALYDINLENEKLSEFERVFEIPFDSKRKYMSVTVKNAKNDCYELVKGGADVVLQKCNYYIEKGKVLRMNPEAREKFIRQNEYMASKALRVLAGAYRKISKSECEEILKGNRDKANISGNGGLIFVGFAGLIDPPREEASEAVGMCLQAGIRTVMITGDHKETAKAIAKEINIPANDVVTGNEIDKMNDNKLQEVVKKVNIFARVLPEHKLRIVKALKRNNNIVAMTGDGVNDAPAVKEADIGISMGISGTDVTREASDMILTDDNFATIVEAVKQGRGIYENIRKFIRYMLACNLGEVVTMFVAMLAGLPIPLYPIQILWVNLVTDGLPGIALGLDPVSDDIMKKKPISAAKGLFTGKLPFLIIFRGILLGLCTVGAFALTYFTSKNIELSRSVAFMTLVMTQLVHAIECRSEEKSIFKCGIRDNLLLLGACAFSFLLMLAVIYIPFLQNVFNTTGLEVNNLIVVFCFTLIGPILGAVIR